MDKMAIFVEGQTEQIFAEKLVSEIAGRHRVHIDAIQAYGGSACQRTFVEVHATRPDPNKEFYVLIYDCMGESRLLSDIRDQHPSLAAQGFSAIVGIRDVYPQLAAEIPTIRNDFTTFAPAGLPVPILVLGIMEIEAWFIAEHTHFERMHASLTTATVIAHLGYDPSMHDVQVVPAPAADLRSVYSSAGLGYAKKRNQIERTVNRLDYALLYLSIRARIPDFDVLADCIDRFLS